MSAENSADFSPLKRSASLSSISTLDAEEKYKIDFNALNKEEFHKISDMFPISHVPKEYYKSVFEVLSRMIKPRYPSEIVNEKFKAAHLLHVFYEIAEFFRKKFQLNEKQLTCDSETWVQHKDLRGKMDYSFVKRANSGEDWFLFVVEVKTDGPRHAWKQLYPYLKEVKRLNPGETVNNFSVNICL